MTQSHQCLVIIDFGGQHTQLLARRIRDLNVYCQIKAYTAPLADIKALDPVGVILSGGTEVLRSIPPAVEGLFSLGIPILGIGYGQHIMTTVLGGTVAVTDSPLRGTTMATFTKESLLFKGIPPTSDVWLQAVQQTTTLPPSFASVAHSDSIPCLAMENIAENRYSLLFHPEIGDTQQGTAILKNFLYAICGATGDWTMAHYAETSIAAVKKQVGSGKVLLALSGGVDSSVLATLLSKAVGNQLTCIFVDHGLMRKNEGDEVEKAFAGSGMHFMRVNAQARFLTALKGITDPEGKRKIIGEEFIRVFEEQAKKIGKVDFLAQGTIYPDIVESGVDDAALVKSHHNVGGLPEHVDFKEIIEPLRQLFKDEVRHLGQILGLPDYLVWRQPFPGPGLGIRIIGEVTADKTAILQEADWIYREEIAKAGLDREISQYFAVLTNLRSVGVSNDARTYHYTLALRAVSTTDFMTANWSKIPYELLEHISARITAEVPMVSRVVFDITSKPPATIEWE